MSVCCNPNFGKLSVAWESDKGLLSKISCNFARTIICVANVFGYEILWVVLLCCVNKLKVKHCIYWEIWLENKIKQYCNKRKYIHFSLNNCLIFAERIIICICRYLYRLLIDYFYFHTLSFLLLVISILFNNFKKCNAINITAHNLYSTNTNKPHSHLCQNRILKL